ncbi:hypothetical protein OBBRIDRAFT_830082 [Obba rivulosa]|uniref:Uncharacterized protein n=1 Tax=Obba rivulosa TaxID=1052685 RepID=A0A8E2J7J6_9APHY|nr:hypothetical protein OBBRIDRAFT_830082 [Obba rivulosa]
MLKYSPSNNPASPLPESPPFMDVSPARVFHPHLLDSCFSSNPSRYYNSDMQAILASTWHILEQAPPPSLRDILDAYRSKGDGDRDMLMAMLNAKSAEDQRLAALASLHKTMLDMYQTPVPPPPPMLPLHVPDGVHNHPNHAHAHSHSHTHNHGYPHSALFPSPSSSSYHSSPSSAPAPHPERTSHARHRTDSSASAVSAASSLNVHAPSARERAYAPSAAHTRKRRRTSRSPAPREHAGRVRSGPAAVQDDGPALAHELPPSPYSSSSTHSSGGSPRSREYMAIGSLLSSSLDHAQNSKEEDSPKRRTSSERSTTVVTASPRLERRDSHT